MPIYDYVCKKCGYIEKDVIARMKDATKKCPKCGGTMERKIGKGVFRINGRRSKIV